MAQFLEAGMIILFGVSWPLNVIKSITSKSTNGKSLLFLLLIELGYISGILGKIISNSITWVFVFYIFNFIMVSLDLILYFINRNKEKSIKQMKIDLDETYYFL